MHSDAPPHCAQTFLSFPWGQMDTPPHSLHRCFWRPCMHNAEPPHSLHLRSSLPCGHFFIAHLATISSQLRVGVSVFVSGFITFVCCVWKSNLVLNDMPKAPSTGSIRTFFCAHLFVHLALEQCGPAGRLTPSLAPRLCTEANACASRCPRCGGFGACQRVPAAKF